MITDLPLVDQVWMFALVIALIVSALAVLVLLGPGFVREVLKDVRALFVTPMPIHDVEGQRRADALFKDADIQELQ